MLSIVFCTLPALIILTALIVKILERKGYEITFVKRLIRIPLYVVVVLPIIYGVVVCLFMSILGLQESNYDTIRGLAIYGGIPLPIVFPSSIFWFLIMAGGLYIGWAVVKYTFKEIGRQFDATSDNHSYRSIKEKLIPWNEFQQKYRKVIQDGSVGKLSELLELIVLCNSCGKGIRIRVAHQPNNDLICPYCNKKWII